MIRKLLITAGLIVATSGLALQATAQTANLYGDEGVKEPSYSSRYELKTGQQLMSQDVKATDERPIYSTEEGFFVRFVKEEDNTIEIAPAQSADDRLKVGIYYKNVVIPETLNVKKGTSVVPCTVVAVGQAAFAFNEVYTVQYPATCKELKDRVFRLASLKECVIPDQIEKIGDNVFQDCKDIAKIEIGKGLKSMGETPFMNCQNLAIITVAPENTILTAQDNILYSKDMTKLYLCPSEIRTPKIVVPNTVKEIEDYAFLSCIYIKELVLNEGLERIGEEALFNCSWLTELTIPASVQEIGYRALTLLQACEKIQVAEGNKTFEVKSDGVNEGKLLINKTKNSLVTCLYKGTKDVTVPEGIKIIEPYAFLSCRWTAAVKLPSSVDSIGQTAFSDMRISEIEIPEQVRVIPKYCISDCAKLTKITLGKNVTLVEDQAFSGNDMMETKGGTLQILAVTPPAVGKDSDGKVYDMGKDFYKKVTLEVPAEARAAYQKDRNWKKFRRVYPVGNELVQPKASLQISVAGGLLSIVAPEVAPIAIYTLDGQVVYTTSALKTQLALPTGLYLVTYGSETIKVFVD
ncbi:leucine-rich repeat domain-containing protein [Porphyromonas sp.]|uniref:leucine-rich repeat domain-containing protein n=1 Tax=Porphyromonas sp. TaxID=1924944 RepID=UPI0025D39692|nr:leucine-rich repeat domain-containing protein [Porphyromonas sp.]